MADMGALLDEAAACAIDALTAAAGGRTGPFRDEASAIRRGLDALAEVVADADDAQQAFDLGRALQDQVTAGLELLVSELRRQADAALM